MSVERSAVNKSTTPDGNESNLPQWRKQFPIDADADTSRSRREFLGGLTVAGGAMACGQVALNKLSPNDAGVAMSTAKSATDGIDSETHAPHVLSKKWHEMAVGESHLFHFQDERLPCLLVKLDEKEFVAFTQKCTHLACPVIPNTDKNEFHCPCHHGSFDLRSGRPLAGPPRSPLRRVLIQRGGDGTLTAIGLE